MNMEKGTALLLIDIQKDYFPGGKMVVPGAEGVLQAASGLLARFRARGLPVIHVRHISIRPGAGFFIPGTEGSEIHQGVLPLQGEKVVEKNFPNSFTGTGLDDILKGGGIDRLVICGMMTHMCIDTTVRAAFDLGYKVVLAHDATASPALSHGGVDVPPAQVQAAYMAALQVFAYLTGAELIT